MPKIKSLPSPVPPSIAARVNGIKPRAPLWAGPSAAGPLGGVTQGMLQDFLRCRERFRLKYVLGLMPPERWDHRTGYGNMWHVCEEFYSIQASGDKVYGISPSPRWEDELTAYAQEQCRLFPLQQQEIEKWYNVCKTQFPLYIEWWSKHPDMLRRTPLLSEYEFDVPYKSPSGRVVRLRGKWDSVDLVDDEIWLQENKAKGEIDVRALEHQLKFDLQTMVYLVALSEWFPRQTKKIVDAATPLAGVRFNIIRRPLAGGQGSIKQREATQGAKCGRKACQESLERSGTGSPGCDKCGGRGRVGAKPAETIDEFCARLGDVIRGAVGEEWGMRPDEHYFFCRLNVKVTANDIMTFRRQFLDPILEQLCDWWAFVSEPTMGVFENKLVNAPGRKDCLGNDIIGLAQYGIHWRSPFGVYYSLDDGGTTEYDYYLETGSEVGLRRADSLFPELKGANKLCKT
jgi:hypothetical protein